MNKLDTITTGGDGVLAAKPKMAAAKSGPDKKTGLSKAELIKLAKEKENKK